MQMYEEVEQILEACAPAIPSGLAIAYLMVRSTLLAAALLGVLLVVQH